MSRAHSYSHSRARSPTFTSLHLCHSSFSNTFAAFPTSQFILQPFRCFIYVTAHSPNPSVASPTSQFIIQPFRRFTYVTAHSPTLLSLLLRHLARRPCYTSMLVKKFSSIIPWGRKSDTKHSVTLQSHAVARGHTHTHTHTHTHMHAADYTVFLYDGIDFFLCTHMPTLPYPLDRMILRNDQFNPHHRHPRRRVTRWKGKGKKKRRTKHRLGL